MSNNPSTADLFREEEEKKRYINSFKETYKDWEDHKNLIYLCYEYYKSIRDIPDKLNTFFNQIDVKEKKEVFPKFVKLSKPRNLQHHEEWKWLKFLGLIRPHKPKTEQNPVPKKEKRVKELQLPRMPVAAEPGTYHVILDDEGIGFPLVKKISKTTGNAVW